MKASSLVHYTRLFPSQSGHNPKAFESRIFPKVSHVTQLQMQTPPRALRFRKQRLFR